MEEKLLEEISSSLKERVFFAARDGMSLTLYALLYEKNNEEIDDLLNNDVCCDGVKCTPLIAAARHGREGAVRILLEKFRPPVRLETEGTVKFDEYVIEGATALWCAAGAGHLGIVKRLVRAGANVNHATKTLSTPLRAACFDGRLDIVKYLVRHGADIHKANKYNNTCLMIASYKGHLDVVQFLLESGARVDERALCGATALHFAAECGHAAVVCALIDHGAKILTNENGMTPLQCAAERARASVVEFLAARPEVTRAQAVEAYELLGASFANDKEYYCIRMAYQYLHRAMAMRYDTRYGLLLKKPAPPIPAYDNWKESTTLEDVERLQGNAHALHMEGLTVRERILGRSCPDLPHPVVFRGAVFADEARFDRCLALWRHALQLRQENSVFVVKDLLRFAQVFSQMIHIGIELPLDQVCFVLEACAEELKRGVERLKKPPPNHDPEGLTEEYESNVRTGLYLVSVAARLLESSIKSEVAQNIRRAVFHLRGARLRSGQTLLHLAVDRRTPVDDFHTSDVCQFPCTRTTRLLLECGAVVDAVDDRHRTPLHIALISYQMVPDERAQWSESLCGVVCELLGRGAHVDATDYSGVTPLIAAIGETEYGRMPPLYALEPYNECLSEPGGVYCVVDAGLFADPDNRLMNVIKEYSAYTKKHFNHTQVHRGLCVTRTCAKYAKGKSLNRTEDLTAILEACLNESLWGDYGLQARMENVINCDRHGESISTDTADITMAIVFSAIILINLLGTIYGVRQSKKVRNGKTGNPYLLCFCVRRNWAKMTASSGTGPEPRLERLKSFHGLRTMTMICVFFSHTAILMNYTYIENPLYVEEAYNDLSKQILLNGTLVVYTFFVMSAFLLAYNFQLHAERHDVTWMDIPKGILLRWLRLTPAYLLVLGIVCTWQRHLGAGPLWYWLVETEAKACRRYWWLHPIYVNNYVYDDAFCMPQAWYLAADMQLFCVGLVICVSARSARARSLTLWVLFAVALLIPAAHTYFQDLDAAIMQTPETMRSVYSKDDTFRLLYIRGHTNLATYVLGLAGGFLAYRWQKEGVDISKYKRYVWLYWAMFPLAVCVILTGGIFYIDGVEVPTALRVAYAVLYKPAFQILVVIAIIGFVFKYEDVYRSIVEWRGWAWCGRVSYSAFLLHTPFQRCFYGAIHEPIHVFDYLMFIVLCATIFITYVSAAVLWLLVEEPINQVFKLLLRGKSIERQSAPKNVDLPVFSILTKL